MKSIFKSTRFKIVAAIAGLLLLGALIAGLFGHGETAQSAIVGTLLSPFHYAGEKVGEVLDSAFGGLSPDAAYEKKIADLEDEIGNLKAQLADYEDMKKQNDLYKDALDLKNTDANYQFEKVSVIARDSQDVFKSFSISKGSLSGIKEGNAVVYKKNLVGVVDKVYPDYSVVKTVLSPDFNVSAYEIISGEVSFVTGNAKLAESGRCKMANLASSTQVAYGSIICSAGIGGKVPKGFVIGTVDEVSEETGDISTYARIHPEVDFDRLTDCLVVKDF